MLLLARRTGKKLPALGPLPNWGNGRLNHCCGCLRITWRCFGCPAKSWCLRWGAGGFKQAGDKSAGMSLPPRLVLGTLAHILLYGEPELDGRGRPLLFYKETIHDHCTRRYYFDNGIFAAKLGDPECMFKLGCRGPVTRADCPIRKWDQYVNWPVGNGSPCIGCAQFGFPDAMEPFVSFDTVRGGKND